MKNPWGWELFVDLKGCNPHSISSPDHFKAFLKALTDGIHMKLHGEPMMEDFAHDDPEIGGYTIMQMISTSSITGHFVTKTGEAYINIFSCQEFDKDKALEIINVYFHPASGTSKLVLRGEDR